MTEININNCKITRYPSKVLASTAQPIEKIDDTIHRLVKKMTEIMIEQKGIGLAGPQAGVPLRIFIISLDGTAENVRVYINPTVTASGDLDAVEEGCLSIPGVYSKIKRYKHAKVTATDLDGSEFTESADGLYARALQHEYDHLEGVTIAQRMGPASKIAHRRQLNKLIEQHETNQG
jgi:peptide deformylase